MGFELTPAFWSGLTQIILVNIILSGDNALVIALACRNLEKKHQRPAIIIGSGGAILLRILFVLIVDYLLSIPFLKLAGGLLLLWIGVKLVQGEEEGEDGVKAASSLSSAIRTIIIADAVMSLDNAIAIAAAAKGVIVVAGGALLGWIAGEVLATDPAYAAQLNAITPHAKTILEIGCAVLVVALGYFLQRRAKQKHKGHDPVDLATDKGKE